MSHDLRLRIVQQNRDLITEDEIDVARNVYYGDLRTLPAPTQRFDRTVIEVVENDTLDQARKMVLEEKEDPLVLNMASDWKPGGGYQKGAGAQEEQLFYRTTYAPILERERHRYPLGRYATIYSEKVALFRANEHQRYRKLREEVSLSFLALPALKRPRLVNRQYTSPDREVMREKIRGIWKVGVLRGHETLLLGALGCGAYRNPPEEVARLFREVAEEYNGSVRRVVFAIIGGGRNYEIFRRILT